MSPIDRSLGVILIDNIFGTILWSLSCSQAWNYFHSFPKDSPLLKITVTVTFLIDSVYQWMVIYWLYGYTITHFGDFAYLSKGPKSGSITVALMEVIVLIVHCFYIWKIWILSRKNWLFVLPITMLAAAHLGMGLYVFFHNLDIDGNWDEYLLSIEPLVSSLYGVMAAADLLISASMVYLLRGTKTEYKQTKSLIQRILTFTLATNLLTGLVAMTCLITAVAWREEIYWIAPFHTLPRVYTNSLYAALNMRPSLAGRSSEESYRLSDSCSQNGPHFFHTRSAGASTGLGAAIHVDTNVQHDYDLGLTPDTKLKTASSVDRVL